MEQSEQSRAKKLPTMFAERLPGKKTRRIVLATIICLAVVFFVAWRWYDARPVLDRSVVAEANFTVYEPKNVPSGYQVNGGEASLKNGILTYTINDKSDLGRDITVTTQAKPSGFDMSAMGKGGSSVSGNITNAGTLYNLSAGGTSQYLLDAGDSLVYITSPGELEPSVVNSLTASFVRVK